MGRPRKNSIVIKEKKEEIKKYCLICPFCQNKQYESYSRDPTSAWCQVCGKCVPVDWKEES